MIKLLVFSDTHGSENKMLDAAKQEKNTHAFIFLGDGSAEADVLETEHPSTPLYRVAGNCDFASLYPTEALCGFGGILFFCAHGHTYEVKSSLNRLCSTAAARGAQAVLYGHTHTAHFSFKNGLYLFNPGSLTIPRNGPASYGRITINETKPLFEIVPV